MYRKISLAVLLALIWVAFSSSSPSGALMPPLIKMNKTINRIWKTDSLAIHAFSSESDAGFGNEESYYFYILGEGDTLGYAYAGRVYSCRSGGCAIDGSSGNGDLEYFDYFFITDKSVTIKKVKVFNYQATHGHEVMGWGWLRQFSGFSGGKQLIYGKDIEAISGATISASSLTTNIQYQQGFLKDKMP